MRCVVHPILKMVTGTFCSRILGLLRDIVFFSILGSGIQASAFLIAFAIPNLFRRLCGEGALNSAFIPVFAQRITEDPNSANPFLNRFFSRISVYLASLVTVSILFLYGFQTFECVPQNWRIAIGLTCLMLPYLWFICLTALYNGALNVFNAFSLTAFSPVILNITMLITLFLGMFLQNDWTRVILLSIGTLLGGVLQWYLPRQQLVQLKIWQPKFCWEQDQDLKLIWNLFVPGVLGAAVVQINILLGRCLAFSIDERAVSLLYLANRFLELPLGLFAFAIISVFLPKISILEAQHNSTAANQALQDSLHMILTLLWGASVGLFLLADPILNLFFCWGRFSLKDVCAAAPLLKIFTVGLPFFGLTALLTRIFYAHKDTKTPVQIAFYALLVYLFIALLGMHRYGAICLALASSLSAIFQWLCLSWILRHRYPQYTLNWFQLMIRKLPCLALMGFGVYACQKNLFNEELSKWNLLLFIIVVISVNLFIYLVSLFKIDPKAFRVLQTILKFKNL